MANRWITLAALALPALIASCASDEQATFADSAALVSELRAYVPSTASYDDDALLKMAENVCTLGRNDGVRILDNYSQLEADDYDAFVTVVFGVQGCPGDADN